MDAVGDATEDSASRGADKKQVPYPAGDNPEVRGVKKFLMILGIVGGFNMYIVPGLFGIRTYRRWKRGEIPPPTRWMVWGAIYLAVIPFSILLGMAEYAPTSRAVRVGLVSGRR